MAPGVHEFRTAKLRRGSPDVCPRPGAARMIQDYHDFQWVEQSVNYRPGPRWWPQIGAAATWLRGWHANWSSRCGALSPLVSHWRASSYVQRCKGSPERGYHSAPFGTRTRFSVACRIDNPRWRQAVFEHGTDMPTRRMDPPPGASSPMRMTASWS